MGLAVTFLKRKFDGQYKKLWTHNYQKKTILIASISILKLFWNKFTIFDHFNSLYKQW